MKDVFIITSGQITAIATLLAGGRAGLVLETLRNLKPVQRMTDEQVAELVDGTHPNPLSNIVRKVEAHILGEPAPVEPLNSGDLIYGMLSGD